MIGITNIYPYLPYYRISLESINRAWNRPAGKGTRSISNYDEDVITMSVNTLSSKKKSWDDLDFLIHATTSSPFVEESSAAIISYVLGTGADCLNLNVNQSLTSGTKALHLGLQLLKEKKKGMIIAADRRDIQSGEDLEKVLGDGACAIEIGVDHVMAKVEAFSSRTDFGYDTWQLKNEASVKKSDDKFANEVKIENLVAVGKDLLETSNLQASDIKWVIVADSQTKLANTINSKLGFTAEQHFISSLNNEIGYLGVSSGFLYLNELFLKANSGDRIMLLQSGSGADGYIFQVTSNIEDFKKENGLLLQLSSKTVIENYNEGLVRRGLQKISELKPYATKTYMRRERENNLRFRGQKCGECEFIHFPKRPNCHLCGSREKMEWIWLERTGTIVTFTHDHVFPGDIEPKTMAVVDLDGGCRIFTQMTNHSHNQVKIGNRVRLSFRKLHEGGDFPNYFWKALPIIQGGV
ncbi:OB-fold domain-containing protein [Neobacillus novalis]|uniref:OB-fold domain-containing protein n=1 Tax=Neobacillus novalis TaxID=220687 RepID=A0AA95MHY1_9BACI|nr:OB-fold domain-containing protein [Neobacillus novalis]WHY83986.1 OB-fold domain-containing protein [Neobacillus novalis]